MSARQVSVIGAGVAGLSAALELSLSGAQVEVIERAEHPGAQACSWFAGGMLAPWCERADTDEQVLAMGKQGLQWWQEHFSGTVMAGTLVLANARDQVELRRMAERTHGFDWLDGDGIAALEPALAGRFGQALFFPGEGHLSPRVALMSLLEQLIARGVSVRFGTDARAVDATSAGRFVLDCRGPTAEDTLPDLRQVRGEMILVHCPELTLKRPVRLLHPRGLVYVVPRTDHVFMVGGSTLESSDAGPVTVRAAVELLNGAYAIHPGFAEARIIELGVGSRPAFVDNLPHLRQQDGRWYLNGLFRHGFLLAPAMARRAAQTLLEGADS